jgi:FdhD protein
MNNVRIISIGVSESVSREGVYSAYEEIPYAVFINGRHTATVLLNPGDQKEYILGYLFTEQYISRMDEVESIRVEKNRISIITTNIFTNHGPKKTILSGCGGAVSYVDATKLPKITSDNLISHKSLVDIINKWDIADSSEKKGIFCACLYKAPGIFILRHDLGEDQVIDRMIGAVIRKNMNLSEFICFYSGTISSETVRKCLISQIPFILTTGEATDLAIEIAEKNGLCVVILKDKEILLCSHPEMIG